MHGFGGIPMTGLTRGRLLIVDDKPELTTALSQFLKEHGYDTAGFTSSAEVLQALNEQKYDLLLAASSVLGIEGGVIEAGLQSDPNLAIIIMAEQGITPVEVKAPGADNQEYIRKPFQLPEVLAVVERALEARRLRLENLQLRETVAIYELTSSLLRTLDLDTVLEKIAATALQQLEAEEVCIMLPTPEGGESYVAAVQGQTRDYCLGARFPMAPGVIDQVTGQIQATDQRTDKDEHFPYFLPQSENGASSATSSVSIPMLANGKLIGILNARGIKWRFYILGMGNEGRGQKILSVLTSTAAAAIEAALLHQQVREAEEKYQSIFENAVEGLFQTTPAGRFLTANPAVARICGYDSPAELIATMTDIARQLYVNPDDRLEFHRQVREYGKGQNIAVEMRRKDGSHFWASINAFAVRDASGAVLYCDGTLEDITERKLAEQALHTANEELENRVVRRTQELEVVNRQLQTRAQQQQAVAELGQQALSGSDLPTLMHAAVALARSVLGVEFTAILELDSANQRFVMRVGIGWPPEIIGQYVAANSKESAAGYAVTSREPVIISDSHLETRFKISPHMREYGLRSGVTVLIHTETGPFGVLGAYTKECQTFTWDDVNFLQALANVLAMAIEHQRSKQEIQQAKEEADRANQAKSEFLSRMSHELRTPLNAVLGFGQILEMDNLTSQQQANVSHIIKGGRHLLGLINEVLDLARIEAGRMHLSLEPVAVRETLEESLAMVRSLASERSIKVKFPENDEDDCNYYVLADQQRLKQVLLNLLGNAIKYNHDGGQVLICVTPADAVDRKLEETTQSDESRSIHIMVRDTGPGIPSEKMTRLFVPFDRLDAEQTSVEGTGLGLALARRLIESMGGKMGVDSIFGQGSTFWFDLAEAQVSPELQSLAEETPAPERSTVSVTASHTHTVLCVEDNLSNFNLIEQILKLRPTVQLLAAMQGSVGLELARQHRPDLILLDIHLPDISGYEVLLRLQATPETHDIPVVVLSADATAGQIERLRLAGAVDYLTKPLNIKQFLHMLDENLEAKG